MAVVAPTYNYLFKSLFDITFFKHVLQMLKTVLRLNFLDCSLNNLSQTGCKSLLSSERFLVNFSSAGFFSKLLDFFEVFLEPYFALDVGFLYAKWNLEQRKSVSHVRIFLLLLHHIPSDMSHRRQCIWGWNYCR